jgi:hypothetical protein
MSFPATWWVLSPAGGGGVGNGQAGTQNGRRSGGGNTCDQMAFWYAPYAPHQIPLPGTNVATLIPKPRYNPITPSLRTMWRAMPRPDRGRGARCDASPAVVEVDASPDAVWLPARFRKDSKTLTRVPLESKPLGTSPRTLDLLRFSPWTLNLLQHRP